MADHDYCRDLSSSLEPLSDVAVPDLRSAVSGSAIHCRSPSVVPLPSLRADPAAKYKIPQ